MVKIGPVPNFVWFLSVAEMAAQLLLQWVPEPDIWASPHSSHFGLVCIFWPYCTPNRIWVPYSSPGSRLLLFNRQTSILRPHQSSVDQVCLGLPIEFYFCIWGRCTVFLPWLDWYPIIFVTSIEPELRTSWPKKVLLSPHQGWKILFEK